MSGSLGGERHEDEVSLTRHEEELHVGTETVVAGGVRVRKDYDTQTVRPVIDRDVEDYAGMDRVPATEEDSGRIEEMDDGSVSIPIFEERLVVTKQLMVRERVIVRKQTTTTPQEVTADLRSEWVEVQSDPAALQVPLGDDSETE